MDSNHEREYQEYNDLLSDLNEFVSEKNNEKRRFLLAGHLRNGTKQQCIEAYSERLEISGMHIKHSVYDEKQLKGFLRDEESVESALVKRKESLAVRKQLDSEIEEYRKRFPNATIDNAVALEELGKILSKYRDALKTREDNELRRINEFKSLINSNWDVWTHFVTLTFADNMTDIDKGQKLFNKWANEMDNYFRDFLYVAVKEFQQRGALHFHCLIRMPYVPKKEFGELRKLWTELNKSTGNIDFKTIHLKYVPVEYMDPVEWKKKDERHIWSLGNYLTSYLKKGASDPRLFGRKLFTSSSKEKLKQKIVITDKEKIHQFLMEIRTDELKKKSYKVKRKYNIEDDQSVTGNNEIGEMHFYNYLIKQELID